LGKEINLGKDLINLFVFCEIALKEQKLIISTETENGQLVKIKEQKMKIRNIVYA